MATSVGLNFRLTAAVDKFEASMRDVEKRLGGIEKASKDTASGMRVLAAIEVGKSVLNGLTGLFNIFKSGVSSVVSFANEARAAADAIGKLSSMTGMTEEPLQVFTRLAGYSGVSAEQFGDAVQKMSRGLGEAARGSGTAGRALESMGLSIDTLLKMSPEQQFATIASAIGEIEDPARKSATAADIFGRSGTKLIPMFEDFESNARATGDEMVRLGQVLSGTQIDSIEAMNDSFDKVYETAFKIGSQVLANFAPMITDANKALIKFVENFQFDGEIGGQALANFLTEAFFDGAAILAKWGDDFLNALSALVDKFADAFEYVFGKQELETPAIKKWNDEIDEYAEQIRQSLIRARKGLESQDEHERKVGALRAAIAEKQKLIAEEENRVLTKKREYNTGLGSMQDSLAKARQLYDEKAKEAQQRQDKVNAAFDKTIENAEKTAANPALDALAEELAKIGKGAATATDPLELFGKANGIAGEELKQLALDAERSASGLSGALDDAGSRIDKFGVSTNASKETLEDWSKNGFNSSKAMEDLTRSVMDASGVSSVLTSTIGTVTKAEEQRRAATEAAAEADRRRKNFLDGNLSIWDQTADRMMAFWKRIGYDPAWLEQQRKAQRDAYERNLKEFYEAKRKRDEMIAERIRKREEEKKAREDKIYEKAYRRAEERKKLQEQAKKDYEAITKFSESLSGWWNGENGDGPDFPETEETLPELQTQTTTLGSILTAVQGFGSNFVQATF